MNRNNLYIFDLDGTLANIEHRRPILANLDNPRRWDEFYKACVGDLPNRPVINIFEMLMAAGHDVIIFSGRSDFVREETEEWLRKNINWPWSSKANIDSWLDSQLCMRKHGDYTPDEILKHFWLNIFNSEQRSRLVVFDDRDKVIKMWRDNGITCFQVANGDF